MHSNHTGFCTDWQIQFGFNSSGFTPVIMYLSFLCIPYFTLPADFLCSFHFCFNAAWVTWFLLLCSALFSVSPQMKADERRKIIKTDESKEWKETCFVSHNFKSALIKYDRWLSWSVSILFDYDPSTFYNICLKFVKFISTFDSLHFQMMDWNRNSYVGQLDDISE